MAFPEGPRYFTDKVRSAWHVPRASVPNQGGTPTRRPTMRRIVQRCNGMDLPVIGTSAGVPQQVLNRTPLHRPSYASSAPRWKHAIWTPVRYGKCRGEGFPPLEKPAIPVRKPLLQTETISAAKSPAPRSPSAIPSPPARPPSLLPQHFCYPVSPCAPKLSPNCYRFPRSSLL
mgnify:CR=1 FL=1